jgi:DNA repair photolyase
MRHKKERKSKKLRSYTSPRWSGEILDCSMPLTFDQYDHCSYNCLYCFSFYQKALKAFNPLMPDQMGKNYQSMEIRSVRVEKIKSLFRLEKKNSQFFDYIKQRIPMQWGGLSDPFDMFEKKEGVGLEILKFLKEQNYPICFSTKGCWWTKDERYTSLFEGQKNWNVKFSIITLDESQAKAIEIGVPSPAERLKALARFNKLKHTGGSTLRLRPFIIGLSDVDGSHKKLIELAADAGVKAVSMEFFCLEMRATESMIERYGKMSDVLGFDLVDFYKRNSPKGSGYLRLNWKIKEKYVNECESVCRKYGLRFYVSDAHHKDRCHNGSCCGLSEKWNYSRGQFTEALMIAKQKGSVRFSDIEDHLQMYKKFDWRVAEGFNTRGTMARCKRWGQTMFDYIREIWNSPKHPKSPYQYFGGLLYPFQIDEDKNVVYTYNPYNKK